ncbi:MAG: hypothetical protein LBC82_04565 [Oscillospiraceae bacterium]|jgi:polyhydroxyalkanoate synthesis regulator phasin|nr:hypothetical protein [Oscillospiraceae bacterium]
MKLTTILIGGAALVGLGIYLSRKFRSQAEEEDAVIYAEEKETYGEKLHKASMFAVGAIKTGADKIVEGIKDIRNQDMVKKGEVAIESAKETASDFIGDLKDKVTGASRAAIDSVDIDDDDIIDEGNDYFMAEDAEEDM